MTGLIRAAFYQRVSTDEQSDRDTIRSQDTALHKHFDAHFGDDATEPWVYVGTFRDDGVSGTVPFDQRPDGQRLLNLIRSGEVNMVCVTRGDRLARDRGVAQTIAREFYDRDISIEATNEHIDLKTSTGQLMFAIMCDFSHFERDLIRDRTTAGAIQLVSEGRFLCGPVPFGYDVVNDRLTPSVRLVEQLGCTEAELVIQIYERIAGGESAMSVVRWLRACGVPSIRRYFNKKKERYHEEIRPHWQHSRVRAMLHSPIYYGQRVLKHAQPGPGRLNRDMLRIEQSVPPLVSRQVWDRAGEAMRGHVSNFNTGTDDGFVYLLTGKMVCAECGFKMIGNYRKGAPDHPTPRLLYACSRAKGRFHAQRTPGQHCIAGTYEGTQIEEIVLRAIDDLVEHPEQTLQALAVQQGEQHGILAQQEGHARALQQRIASLERGRAALVESMQSGDLTAAEFRAASAKNTDQQAEVRRQMGLLEAEDALAKALDAQLREAREIVAFLGDEWPKARAAKDRPELRAMIQPLVQQVRISKDRSIQYTILFERSTDSHCSHDYLRIVRPLTLSRAA
jgi:site-specific DNA recombinase